MVKISLIVDKFDTKFKIRQYLITFSLTNMPEVPTEIIKSHCGIKKEFSNKNV